MYVNVSISVKKPPFVFPPGGGKATSPFHHVVMEGSPCPLRGKGVRKDGKGAFFIEHILMILTPLLN